MIKDKQTPSRNRGGFTLVELLTVLVIISILAIVALGVQRASVQSARTARTRTTIAKIDSVITSMYEKYQYRKVDVDQFSDQDLAQWMGLPIDTANPEDANRGKAKFLLRTLMLREMILMDMPTCSNEMNYNSIYGQVSPLQSSYRSVAVDDMTNAELLYLIVTNGDPESRTMFHEREIGDTNENGLNEFVDGWGNPICFLRWAPGLNNSSRQPTYDEECRYWNNMTEEQSEEFQKRYSDPLNPLGLAADGQTDDYPSDWLLVPLIFSYGPDEEPGMDEPEFLGNPFKSDFYIEHGTLTPPGKDSGKDESDDNITNHNFYN